MSPQVPMALRAETGSKVRQAPMVEAWRNPGYR